MLTIRENLKEVMTGGKPDRFVNQYEFMDIIMECPTGLEFRPGETWVDQWGITWRWPEGQLGQFPVHDEEHILLKDITKWREQVKIPPIIKDDAAWAPAVERAKNIDRTQRYATIFVAPGVFEMTHHLMSMEHALMALYEEPEAMHDLIDALVEHELAYAEEAIKRVKPDALFHHDDWGSQKASFVSPEMFEEFFVEPYKKIYGYYKANGVELIVHHNDSWSANLVPYMIEMGIDIWQGVMSTNNTKELIDRYGEKITFMGDLDSGKLDFPAWTPEIIRADVERSCRANGKYYFIPCLSQGLGISSFPGVYEETSKAIDEMSKILF